METQSAPTTIRRAFFDAQARRPYKSDPDIVTAATPPGGDWSCVAAPGAISRSVMWGRVEVAHVNPAGDLDDSTEGQIAMAIRAIPTVDAAMRAIIVLAESADNLAVIQKLAISTIAFIEAPAPPCRPELDDEEPED